MYIFHIITSPTRELLGMWALNFPIFLRKTYNEIDNITCITTVIQACEFVRVDEAKIKVMK